MKANETRLFYFLVLTDLSDIRRGVKEGYGWDCSLETVHTLSYKNKLQNLGFQKAEEGKSRDDDYVTNLTD